MPNAVVWTFGGAIVVSLLSLLVGLAFKPQDPTARAVHAVGVSFVICSAVAGFASAQGGVFQLDTLIDFAPGAILSLYFLHSHCRKGWREDETVARARDPRD